MILDFQVKYLNLLNSELKFEKLKLENRNYKIKNDSIFFKKYENIISIYAKENSNLSNFLAVKNEQIQILKSQKTKKSIFVICFLSGFILSQFLLK